MSDTVKYWEAKADEGNDAGALFTAIDNLETIPVIRKED